MNGDDERTGRDGPNANRSDEPDEDLGAPVLQLMEHSVPVSSGFRSRVSRSIERRLLAADATHFGVVGPFATLIELLRALFEGLGLIGPDAGTAESNAEERQ